MVYTARNRVGLWDLILANCFDNNVGLVVELRESRSDSDNRYQQRSFDCLPYQQRPTQLVVGIRNSRCRAGFLIAFLPYLRRGLLLLPNTLA